MFVCCVYCGVGGCDEIVSLHRRIIQGAILLDPAEVSPHGNVGEWALAKRMDVGGIYKGFIRPIKRAGF